GAAACEESLRQWNDLFGDGRRRCRTIDRGRHRIAFHRFAQRLLDAKTHRASEYKRAAKGMEGRILKIAAKEAGARSDRCDRVAEVDCIKRSTCRVSRIVPAVPRVR